MSAEDFRLQFRGSPIRRAKHSGVQRNVAIAMGNSADRKFLPLLEKLAANADPTVSDTAAWAIRKLAEGAS
jgi:epoxyqueuosine reductase